MVVESNLEFGLAAWGKHDKNSATITSAVNTPRVAHPVLKRHAPASMTTRPSLPWVW
jgi:hypothetical protein